MMSLLSDALAEGPVTGPAAWRPSDFDADRSWVHTFTSDQVAALRDVAAHRDGIDFAQMSRDRIRQRLAPLQQHAAQLAAELGSRGFVLLRGAPVHDLSREAAGRAFWALGTLLGTGLTQNAQGELLCPVTDVGVKYGTLQEQTSGRGYQSRATAAYHVDPADVVGLLCLRRARTGGASTIVSTTSIYNEILARHPEHLEVLLRGFPYSRKDQQWPSESPVTDTIPVFVRHADRVSCRYTRSYILGGMAKRGLEPTQAELEALACFDAIANRPDMVLQMSFEPGDIQLLNNFTVAHGRTEYEDHEEADQRRFLYRLWLHLDDTAPWTHEGDAMRWAHARFGNLGRTAVEWSALQEARAQEEVAVK